MQIQIEYTGFQQQVRVDGHPFVPMIYDGRGDVPEGFNAVCISLDASDRSSLQWHEALQKADRLKARGLWIVWDLQLALHDGSLEDDTRFMTLQLGVQHFVENILPAFHDTTLGVILFKGLFSEEVKRTIEYLKLLAALLPEALPAFLFLDTMSVVDPATFFRLTALEAFGHLRLGLQGPCVERFPYALPALSWGHFKSPLGGMADHQRPLLQQARIEYGICLPEKGGDHLVGEAACSLGDIPFRVIPEALLTQEWDGIEKLIIFPDWLEERGWRKIRGFLAAGGEVIPFPVKNFIIGDSESSRD